MRWCINTINRSYDVLNHLKGYGNIMKNLGLIALFPKAQKPKRINKARLIMNRVYSTTTDRTEYRCRTTLCNWVGMLRNTIPMNSYVGCPCCGQRVIRCKREN